MDFVRAVFSSVLRRVTALSNYRAAQAKMVAAANEAKNTALAFSSLYIMILTEMETNFDFPTYVQSCNGDIF